MRLEDLTWKEVEEYLRSNQQLIVPVGTCEQHGPHLPLNTDTLVAEEMAEYLSAEAGILVAPTLNDGVNLPCDQGYAGTCSTTEELLAGFLASVLEWWKGQGFERFFVCTAHGLSCRPKRPLLGLNAARGVARKINALAPAEEHLPRAFARFRGIMILVDGPGSALS